MILLGGTGTRCLPSVSAWTVDPDQASDWGGLENQAWND